MQEGGKFVQQKEGGRAIISVVVKQEEDEKEGAYFGSTSADIKELEKHSTGSPSVKNDENRVGNFVKDVKEQKIQKSQSQQDSEKYQEKRQMEEVKQGNEEDRQIVNESIEQGNNQKTESGDLTVRIGSDGQSQDGQRDEDPSTSIHNFARKLLDVIMNLMNMEREKYAALEQKREVVFEEEKLGALFFGFICGYVFSKGQAQQTTFLTPPITTDRFGELGQGLQDPFTPFHEGNRMSFLQQNPSHPKKQSYSEFFERHQFNSENLNFSFPNQTSLNSSLLDVPFIPESKRPRSSRSIVGPSYNPSTREEKINAYKVALGVQREGVLELFQKQPWCERQKPSTIYRQWKTLQNYLMRQPTWYKQWREFSVVSKAAVLSRVSNNSDRLEYILEAKPEKSSMYQILTRADQEFNKKNPFFRDWLRQKKEMYASAVCSRANMGQSLNFTL